MSGLSKHPAFRFLSSLRLTVACLALSMVLIFVGTLAQVQIGIHAMQEQYIHAFFVWGSVGGVPVPVFPGGFLLGAVLLVNLVCAHVMRFRPTWNKAGITAAHAGIALLIVGEFLTAMLAQESQMPLDEGQMKSFSESVRRHELAVVDLSDPDFIQEVAFRDTLLHDGATLRHKELPFTLKVLDYMPNSRMAMAANVTGAPPSRATRDIGMQIAVQEIPRTARADRVDIPAAYVQVLADGQDLGTWLLSSGLAKPQILQYGGRRYQLQLQPMRLYKPFAVELVDFTHDRFLGTNIPRNFSSQVRIIDPAHNEEREVLIYMNNPLRYRGYTFYQHSFANNDKTSILQVVQNPAWTLPYIACAMITLGITWHFLQHLSAFLINRMSPKGAGA